MITDKYKAQESNLVHRSERAHANTGDPNGPVRGLTGNKTACAVDWRDPPQTQGRRHGSFESISTKRIRHGSLPRLTQAWLVACCTITSPGFRCTSPSSSIMSISPERMIA